MDVQSVSGSTQVAQHNINKVSALMSRAEYQRHRLGILKKENPVDFAKRQEAKKAYDRAKYHENKNKNPETHAEKLKRITEVQRARREKNNNPAVNSARRARDLKAHKAKYNDMKNNNPAAYAEWLKKKNEYLKAHRAQKKRKEIAIDLEFDPNVFDSDVDSDTELGSEWDFEWDPNKDVSGSASAADQQPFNSELYYPQGPQVNSYLESDEALQRDQPFGGKIKSLGLTIKRKYNNKKSIKRKRHKINKRLTIKHNNKKRRKTIKIRKTK